MGQKRPKMEHFSHPGRLVDMVKLVLKHTNWLKRKPVVLKSYKIYMSMKIITFQNSAKIGLKTEFQGMGLIKKSLYMYIQIFGPLFVCYIGEDLQIYISNGGIQCKGTTPNFKVIVAGI